MLVKQFQIHFHEQKTELMRNEKKAGANYRQRSDEQRVGGTGGVTSWD